MLSFGGYGHAQNPPVPAPTGPVNPPAATPVPAASSTPFFTPAPGESPIPVATPLATPSWTPTPVPIVAEPSNVGVVPGTSAVVRATGASGVLAAKIADESIASVSSVDASLQTVTVLGEKPGLTTLTLSDDRGMTRDVPVRVAYTAGTIAPQTSIRITGNPATARFIRHIAAEAAAASAELRPGATIALDPDSVEGAGQLAVSDVLTVSVPFQLNGSDYFSVAGTTKVRIENVALPHIRPSRLLVSDYPEQLRENGVLFTATLDTSKPQRFLYYHDNPAGQPARRIVLRAHNPSAQPAVLQFISGEAGPEANEMEVGHASTLRFLAREAQNEGSVVVVPPNDTITLVNQLLPPQNTVSNLLQLREVQGDAVDLSLVAQDAGDPIDKAPDSGGLLQSSVKHARGIYRVPEFYFDYTYDTGMGQNLEIPIGQLPLPNLREGQALGGDYGVLQSINVTVVNPTGGAAAIALYENPRGGRATGTYIVDRTLVQSHAAAAFSKWKLRQYRIPPHSIFRISVVTMPEGGSSYPVRLILAPDDGSAAPGSPGSPVY